MRAEFIFHPLTVFRIMNLRGHQAQHCFIELPRPRHVGDGVATARDLMMDYWEINGCYFRS